jgi:hypothetical protein
MGYHCDYLPYVSGIPRGWFGVFNPPKFRSFDEAEPKYVVLTYQKLRKFYYMKWNFLYQTISAPRSPFSLCSVNWICWTPPKKNPGLNPSPPRKNFLGTPLLISTPVHFSLGKSLCQQSQLHYGDNWTFSALCSYWFVCCSCSSIFAF